MGKYYVVIRALRKDVSVKSELGLEKCSEVSDAEMYDEADYVYAGILLKIKTKFFVNFLKKKENAWRE